MLVVITFSYNQWIFKFPSQETPISLTQNKVHIGR